METAICSGVSAPMESPMGQHTAASSAAGTPSARSALHTCSKVTALIRFYYGRGFYISDVDYSRGYPRAELIKEYE